VSLDKIAKILHVDEVQLMHGPKGVAVHVRIEKSWHTATIDNDDLKGRRLEAITEHLTHLADAHIGKVRDALRKGPAMYEGATRAALRADREADLRRGEGWGNDWFSRPYDGPPRQAQIQRDYAPTPTAPLMEPPAEPTVTEPMPSRFHAIMAELRSL
jgi:hypothetical protein